MKAAIIGCGFQGKRVYEALREIDVEVGCIIDLNPDGVIEKIPEFSRENIYTDAIEGLKAYNPDAVCIATHSAARLENVRKAIEAGIKKIFVEKPMATNLNDAQEMIKLAQEAGVLLAVNHLKRWSPNHHRLSDVLKDGKIGDVAHIYAQCGSVGLGNVGTHLVDSMRYYTNSEVDWVMGEIDKTGTPNPRGAQYSDPGGWGMIKFKDGTRAFIDTCEDTGVPIDFHIVGKFGRAEIDELGNDWKVYARNSEDREVPLTRYGTSLEEVPFDETIPWDVKEFTKLGLKELILEDHTSCSGEEGYRNLEIILAMHISDKQNGAKVHLPLEGENKKLDIPWA